MDIFIIRILIVGLGIAMIAGPLGCFVVWRRMAYFGDAVAHAALLGLVLSFLWQWESTLGVFIVTLSVAGLLLIFQRSEMLSNDTVLGILAHGSLAGGLLAAYLFVAPQTDLTSILLGDIIAVNWTDTIWVGCIALLVLGILAFAWKGLVCLSVDPELAAIEGRRPQLHNAIFVIVLALVISVAIKIVGVLLITALMIIPAATARFTARSPESMAIFAALYGMIAICLGLLLSFRFNTPIGPSVVMVALVVFFLLSLAVFARERSRAKKPGMKARW